ncbi:hypothetical protein PR202_gb19567 [Eleusine coracana subsp. coracana]|uniref:Protein SCAR n=1 Tax=Eleusine coracana subsp. coracana TaxID=191504 RepID=A0AAV5F7Z3_ELECO|nr:hypothetical protein PR202_gb19567 [Eleusine coracana subsp. coracana]
MPLSRHKVGNEYALGGRDLYRAADQHDPEAVLDGVAMAGLVGVLRQLGDLAEFAAQVFHGLYDEVMSTSARGHGLMLRVQQLEAELPLLEKDSCHRDYLYVASNKGVEWHMNPSLEHGVVTTGDTPRFIMESIKQCRGPPKLFMLDKYDIGGEGACLKRYTDPSFFKMDSACSSILQEGIQRERRPLRAMEIRPNLQNEEIFRPPSPANTDSKLESDLSGQALGEVPTRRKQLKYRQRNGSVFQNFRPHMQNLNDKVSSEEKLVTVDSPETNTEERDIMIDTSIDMDKLMGDRSGMVRKNRSTISEEALSRSSDARSAGSSKGYNSEVEIYVDALTTMDSEVETDTEHRDQWHRAFVRMDSDNTCSDANNAMASRSSSFERKDLLDVASESGDVNDQHEEASLSTPQAKPVPGEHERTSSLEEPFVQEKLVSCDHERTSSLEDLLLEDGHASGEQATDWSCNAIVSNTVSNVTQDITKNAKEAKENSNIATISFKKIASKRSKYVGGMELIASKVGILPRKLSKKHDPFSDSLRSMAKQLLELKYDGTQDTELYEFEDNDVGLDVKCLEMYSPPVEINESAMQRIPSDSPHDDVSLRECHQEEVSHESEHDLPPTDSPQDSVPDDGNGFEDSHIHYLTGMSSPIFLEEEAYAGTECDEHSATSVVNHILEHAEEKIEEHADGEVAEDTHTEVTSENASDMGEDSKEASICAGQVNVKDINESNEYDAYMSDDENIEHIEEQVVSDDMISSPVSSKQSDNPCQITPLILSYGDDTVACKESDSYNPEAHNITLSEALMTVDLTKMVSETETAIPGNEQYYPESAFGQDIAVSSNEVGCQIEQLTLCNSSTLPLLDSTVKTEENHELHWDVHQEIRSARNSSTEVLGDPLALDSRDIQVPVISSFDWMLNGTMHKSFNVLTSQPTYGNVEVSGSSEDIQDPPPLPPLPPMQWRTNKLQTGSSALSAKSGRPPRPKPPVKHQESDDNSSLDWFLVSMRQINSLARILSHVYASNQDENELIVIPEEAWSEFGDIKLIADQDGKQQLSIGFSGCNGGMHTAGLSTEKTIEKHQAYLDHKEKEFLAAGSKKVTDSEENKPNGALKQDGILDPDLPTQQDDSECSNSGDKSREVSTVLEEEPSMSLTHSVPRPPRYPLLPVTSHDRSMAPTLVQPSSKLSDEKNNILEQIKNKSFNLKPVLAKRPNVMGGPRTNLQVVAILERAHAIRQAVADDDDEEDSWSE